MDVLAFCNCVAFFHVYDCVRYKCYTNYCILYLSVCCTLLLHENSIQLMEYHIHSTDGERSYRLHDRTGIGPV